MAPQGEEWAYFQEFYDISLRNSFICETLGVFFLAHMERDDMYAVTRQCVSCRVPIYAIAANGTYLRLLVPSLHSATSSVHNLLYCCINRQMYCNESNNFISGVRILWTTLIKLHSDG